MVIIRLEIRVAKSLRIVTAERDNKPIALRVIKSNLRAAPAITKPVVERRVIATRLTDEAVRTSEPEEIRKACNTRLATPVEISVAEPILIDAVFLRDVAISTSVAYDARIATSLRVVDATDCIAAEADRVINCIP